MNSTKLKIDLPNHSPRGDSASRMFETDSKHSLGINIIDKYRYHVNRAVDECEGLEREMYVFCIVM